ncbi:hypothetical protein [Streptosporangium subroseum]|nr:hypothetical protein [Streptosporangium subroseum]
MSKLTKILIVTQVLTLAAAGCLAFMVASGPTTGGPGRDLMMNAFYSKGILAANMLRYPSLAAAAGKPLPFKNCESALYYLQGPDVASDDARPKTDEDKAAFKAACEDGVLGLGL